MELSEYLLQRGITLEPIKIAESEDLILADKELVKGAGELWHSKQNLITLIIQNRVNAIGKRILNNCTPYELTVLRDAMVEINELLGDFAKYHAEAERLKANEQPEIVVEDEAVPAPEQGEEDQPSL